jgi:hypothetical protein
MRKNKTHSARALGKKSARKRGGRKRDARAPKVVLCALGAGILAATYGFTHQRPPEASANVRAQTPAIATPKEDKEIANTPSADPAINAQALRKTDRLVTGSVPKQEEIAPLQTDIKAKPQVAKKKKATTVAKAPKSFMDYFRPETPQKR